MKKPVLAVLAFFAAACAGTGTNNNLKPMNIQIENEFGNALVSWEKPEGKELHYDVLIHTVSGSDGGKTGEMVCSVPTEQESFRAGDYIAWYAQEHEYYGPVAVQVTAYDGETVIAQGDSEPIMAEECLPAVKELILGEDVKPEDIILISWSGTGEMREDNFHITLVKEDDEYTLDAEFYDENGPHLADRTVDEAVFEQAKRYLEGGRIVRKTMEDPEIIWLDRSESGYQLWWNDMSELERSRYEFLPADSQEWHFKEFLKEITLE
ncbi:MAG: hypothetical protein IIZ10_03215 [Solobacterium sp.]|nr:hypothetical protein [Solobacterium sp.]